MRPAWCFGWAGVAEGWVPPSAFTLRALRETLRDTTERHRYREGVMVYLSLPLWVCVCEWLKYVITQPLIQNESCNMQYSYSFVILKTILPKLYISWYQTIADVMPHDETLHMCMCIINANGHTILRLMGNISVNMSVNLKIHKWRLPHATNHLHRFCLVVIVLA